MYSAYKKVCAILKENEYLSDYTTFGIGGKAKLMLFPRSESELIQSLDLAKTRSDKVEILGCGSNVLVSDKGFDGVIIITRKLDEFQVASDRITASCGARLPALCLQSAKESLSGLEFAQGIPASLGGAIVMNAGAYGQTIGECVESVKVWQDGNTIDCTPEFSYRKSGIKKGSVVLSATLKLKRELKEHVLARIKGMKEARNNSQPLSMRSAGCIFLSEDGVSAGYYVDTAGLKGARAGGAEISTKHAGFIINRGGASAKDVVALIQLAKDRVKEKFGKTLHAEIKFLGEFDETLR